MGGAVVYTPTDKSRKISRKLQHVRYNSSTYSSTAMSTFFRTLPVTPLLLVVLLVIGQNTRQATAAVYKVTPSGKWTSSSGFSSKTKVYNLPDALGKAKAGDTVFLSDGTYTDRVESVTAGKSGSPIKIKGGDEAVIKAESPSVLILHSWITIQGFKVDGMHDSKNKKSSYVNKCVRVEGTGRSGDDPLEGFVMKDMTVKNCGTECVRLKNYVVNAAITGNNIKYCGVYDFAFYEGGKNGEGIYIGTSSTQWTHGEDRSNGIIIRNNVIATHGSECVDIKEGSYGNVIEENKCSNQCEKKSGCFSVRGDGNIISNNDMKDCLGVGVRLGGGKVDGHQYGQSNDVYGNSINHAEMGSMSVTAMPQGVVCDNTCKNGACRIDGEKLGDIPEMWDADC